MSNSPSNFYSETDRSPSRRYYRSKSRRRHYKSISRSRSRSRSYYRSRSRSVQRRYRRSRSKNSRYSSPTYHKRSRYESSKRYRSYSIEESLRLNPPRNNILAIFGLDRDTSETDLYNMFHKYDCKECKVIHDKRTGKPRGFGFVYFDCIDDASRAKHATDGKRLLSREIRVDYSIGEKKRNNNQSFT